MSIWTNFVPLFAFCFVIILSLSDNNQADAVEAFNSSLRYLDDFLNIDTPYFDMFGLMVSQIYPTLLQSKASLFLYLDLHLANIIV